MTRVQIFKRTFINVSFDEQVNLLHPHYKYMYWYIITRKNGMQNAVFLCVFYSDEECKCITISVCCWMGDLALQQQNFSVGISLMQ